MCKNKSKWSFLKAVTMWLNWLTEHIRLIKWHCSLHFIDKTVKPKPRCGGNRLPTTITLNVIFLNQTIPFLFLPVHILSYSSSRVIWNHVLINFQRGLWQRENRFNLVSKKREAIPSTSDILIRALVRLDLFENHIIR